MTPKFSIHDPHKGEPILSECPRCRLPIYASDPRRQWGGPKAETPVLYHAGCQMAAKGEWLEQQIAAIAAELRGCGYVVELGLVRPVR